MLAQNTEYIKICFTYYGWYYYSLCVIFRHRKRAPDVKDCVDAEAAMASYECMHSRLKGIWDDMFVGLMKIIEVPV